MADRRRNGALAGGLPRRAGHRPWLMAGAAGIALCHAAPAQADCDFVPTAGDDTYVCDSGSSAGGLDDFGGDNTLTFPAGGSGTVAGDVNFGGGADAIVMESGTIADAVHQGDGDDRFEIAEGTVTGNVQQGDGLDDFAMTGGQIDSLNQGGDLDTFFMSGGRIVDAFDDGDHAVMTGGRIGRVNLKLADNVFDMSGGTIDRNLVAGFGDDTIVLSGGTIGGNISVSGGTDSVTITGGSVGGEIRMSSGDDLLTWDGGGIVHGAIDMSRDDDSAVLANLTDANLGAVPEIAGGDGVDALTLANVTTGEVARFTGWETIALTDDTEIAFAGTLVLGDVGTGTGTLTIDASSTLFGGGGHAGVAGFAAGATAMLVNAGRIDLTGGGSGPGDTFTVAGDYVGEGGLLLLDTVLGDDSSLSDRLVIDGGTATGTTGVTILNAGGAGAETTADGILVVEALNGASTASGAFALNHRVAIGAFEYFLFRGGLSNGTGENWYLRSTLANPPADVAQPEPAPAPPPNQPPPPPPPPVAPEPPAPPPAPVPPPPPLPPEPTPADPDPVDPAPPVEEGAPPPPAPPPPAPAPQPDPPPPPPPVPEDPAPVPVAGAPVAPPTPGATADTREIVPLYRPEVPAFVAPVAVMHHLSHLSLGTFHERRGEQGILRGGGILPATWGRLFAEDSEIKWRGDVAPSFDGDFSGFQVGQDLVGLGGEGGDTLRLGIFGGRITGDGTVRGRSIGWNDLTVGQVEVRSTTLAGYASVVGADGWYVDAVFAHNWFEGGASADTGMAIDLDGTGLAATLEAGYPLALSPRWTLEPQAQIEWREVRLDDREDAFSTIGYARGDALAGRLGLRLAGDYGEGGARILPYVHASVLHGLSGSQAVRFGSDAIRTDFDRTAFEGGAGVVARLGNVALHLKGDYALDAGGPRNRRLSGTAGLTIAW
ncbi:autotransporter outer membrane beta-barrel domain-containing protein [Altererythrobacter marinus]|uniref:Autotransporter outer membrane beta-barrel domain-containing protein n=2 Tax=Pelagerythrobacter marinus TaxID=538382 RepID=A0ABW9UT06_9SPHN|nr:autotransporter outer membrane beta-barrel domain-containing protein [Pelagerythrobacter marinus]